MKNQAEVQALLNKVLEATDAPEVRVSYGFSSAINTRFGENAITQNMARRSESLHLTVAFDNRHGSSGTDSTDDDAIAALVRRACDIAANAPADPEYVPGPGPQDYPDVPRHFFEETAAATPNDLARGVRTAVDMAKEAGYVTGGLHSVGTWVSAMASSNGLFAYDRGTDAGFSVTMHGPKGGSSAFAEAESLAAIHPEAIARKALTTAREAQNPSDIEPGDYTVIMEPEAVAEFVSFLFWNLGARSADEGTTALSGKLGEKLFSERITVRTVLDDPDLPGPRWGAAGLAAKPATWIRNGVLEKLSHDRYWAREKGVEPDPVMYPLLLEGGTGTTADLVASCTRGLLIKRLWYIRYVDEKELLLTGMTRDGVFLVENGRIVRPVINLRFNESPLVFLRNAVALSRPVRVEGMKVPAIMSEGFTLDSKTASL